MSWTSSAVQHLAGLKQWGYGPDAAGATEPTALAALALLAHDQPALAAPALDWLSSLQNPDGSVGINRDQSTPGWTTSLAILAWRAGDQAARKSDYQKSVELAVRWLLHAAGVSLPRTPELGHDTTIDGWPWVLGTHSWLEPTAWAVLALRATGHGRDRRFIDGVRLLIDRLLPTGGANYGNTFVLGQQLRPQVEATGLAMLALKGQPDPSGRIEASCAYLESALSADTPAISLSYGLLGLAAQGRPSEKADELLQAAFERTARQGFPPLNLALLLLAAQADDAPLMTLAQPAGEAP